MSIIAPAAVCFHCQQLVEKYLKMYLIYKDIPIQRTYNIEFLLVECSKLDTKFLDIDPLNLSDFSIDIRYPGDIMVSNERDAILYKELAFNVMHLVQGKISTL
ncbi:MAG: HEPN domain-containing protein [Bacteroidota bacterium]